MAEAYYKRGETAKADAIMEPLADKAVEYITWYMSLGDNHFFISSRELEYHMALLNEEIRIMEKHKSGMTEAYLGKLNTLYEMYKNRMKGAR